MTVTFPEGFTVMQIAQVLEEAGVCDDQAFVEVAQNYSPQVLLCAGKQRPCL